MTPKRKTLDEFKAEVIAAFPAFKDAEFAGVDGAASAYLGDGFIYYSEGRTARYRWTVGATGRSESATLKGAVRKYRHAIAGTLTFVAALGAKP